MQRVFGEVFEYIGAWGVALMDSDTKVAHMDGTTTPLPATVLAHQPETRCMRCLRYVHG
jgi:hypothetical protein